MGVEIMAVSGLDCLVEAVEAVEAAQKEGFMCPHPGCGRVFSKRYNQQAHMRIHDGTKPFGCDRCGKMFMWKSSLKSHARMHDKLEKGVKRASGKKRRKIEKRSPTKTKSETSSVLRGFP